MLLGRVWPQSQASGPNKVKDASAMAKATHLFSGCDVLACVHRISKARSSIADTAGSLTMDCKGAVSRKFARCRKRLSGGIRLGQQCVMDGAMFLRSKRHVLNTPVQDLIDRQSGFAVGDLLYGFSFRRPEPRRFRRFYRSSRFARHKITVNERCNHQTGYLVLWKNSARCALQQSRLLTSHRPTGCHLPRRRS